MAFIDIRLSPGPDGVWTAEHIRKVDPYVEIVIVTGYSDRDIREISLRVPPPDKLLYLQKPFEPQEIWQMAFSLGAKWQLEHQFRRIQAELEAIVKQRTSALLKANKQLKEEIRNRVETEMALREGEAKFRSIITSNADAIIILDPDGIVRFVNPAAESLFDRRAVDFIGEFFGFPVIAGETTEIDIVKGNGNRVVAAMRVVKTEWGGEMAYLASLRDITDRKQMEAELHQSVENLEKAMRATIQAMGLAVESRDPYTAGHEQRVADLAYAIAKEMNLSKERIDATRVAGLIHDIGKISVPAEILSKPRQLTEVEFKLTQTHPEVGYTILKPIEFPWPIAQMVLQHHERWDGSGYPQGLSGEEILLEARILAVADVVEAISSHRPYRAALGIKMALKEISQNRGTLYDPEVVDACVKLFAEKRFDFEWSSDVN